MAKQLQLTCVDDYSNTLFPDFMKATENTKKQKPAKLFRDTFHLDWLEGVTLTDFGMPIVEPYNDALPSSLVSFTDARAIQYKGISMTACPHFYIEDSRFTCILNDLPSYTAVLSHFPEVISPDFSIKMDMPEPLKMYNSYLNKLTAIYMQMRGLKVIPNVVWADPRSYDFCFAGYPDHSVVAVNSMGVKGNRQSVFFWQKGYEEMINRLHPTHILRYGERIIGEDEAISTFYPNNHLNRMRHGR